VCGKCFEKAAHHAVGRCGKCGGSLYRTKSGKVFPLITALVKVISLSLSSLFSLSSLSLLSLSHPHSKGYMYEVGPLKISDSLRPFADGYTLENAYDMHHWYKDYFYGRPHINVIVEEKATAKPLGVVCVTKPPAGFAEVLPCVALVLLSWGYHIKCSLPIPQGLPCTHAGALCLPRLSAHCDGSARPAQGIDISASHLVIVGYRVTHSHHPRY